MTTKWYWRAAAWSSVPVSAAALFAVTGNPWGVLAGLALAVAGSVRGLWLPAAAVAISLVHVWLAWAPVIVNPMIADSPDGENLRQAGEGSVAFSPEGMLMLGLVLVSIGAALVLWRRTRPRAEAC